MRDFHIFWSCRICKMLTCLKSNIVLALKVGKLFRALGEEEKLGLTLSFSLSVTPVLLSVHC